MIVGIIAFLYGLGVVCTLAIGLYDMWLEANFVDSFSFDEEAYKRGKFLVTHALIFPYAIFKLLHTKFKAADEAIKVMEAKRQLSDFIPPIGEVEQEEREQ